MFSRIIEYSLVVAFKFNLQFFNLDFSVLNCKFLEFKALLDVSLCCTLTVNVFNLVVVCLKVAHECVELFVYAVLVAVVKCNVCKLCAFSILHVSGYCFHSHTHEVVVPCVVIFSLVSASDELTFLSVEVGTEVYYVVPKVRGVNSRILKISIVVAYPAAELFIKEVVHHCAVNFIVFRLYSIADTKENACVAESRSYDRRNYYSNKNYAYNSKPDFGFRFSLFLNVSHVFLVLQYRICGQIFYAQRIRVRLIFLEKLHPSKYNFTNKLYYTMR